MARGDGIHFGTGEEPDDGITGLLHNGDPCLLNEPEAQWHYARMKQAYPDSLMIWRASPDLKPAQLGWDAHAYSREIFKSLDAHHDRFGSYPTEVLLLNELNLDYERGEPHNDGGAWDSNPANWAGLYTQLAKFLWELLDACKERAERRDGFKPRWWFQGWAPGHGEMEPSIAGIWVPTAQQYDGIVLHAYHDHVTITDTTLWYNQTFPDKPLLLGEWDMQGFAGDWRSATGAQRRQILAARVEEETATRARLKALADQLTRFYACYFIHYWGEDSSHEHDIRAHDERKAIWDGRVAIASDGYQIDGQVPEEPTMTPETFPIPMDDRGVEWQADRQTVLDAIDAVAPGAIDPVNPKRAILLLRALGFGESGFNRADPSQDFQAQDRWHIWNNHGREAVRQRNWGYAAEVLGWGAGVGEIGTNDYSAGVFHQAWAWWDQFPGNPMDPNDPHRWDVTGWLNFRKVFIQDHGMATRYAAARLKPYYDQRPGDLLWVLERYNKPNGEVSENVRANYQRALAYAAETMTVDDGTGTIPDPPKPSAVAYELFPDPHRWGTFVKQPKGLILHGSRSGRASNPLQAEYAGTARYEQTNSFTDEGGNWYKLGWNATIGPNVVALHLNPREWGNNARAASDDYLAVEIAQPTVNTPVPDECVAALADYWVTRVLPIWPNIPRYFPTHAEVERSGETGYRDGKDDVFPFGSAEADELRARLNVAIDALLGVQPGEPDPGQPDPPKPPETDAEKVVRMTSAIGYLTGDMVSRIEHARVIAGDSGAQRYDDTMTKEQLAENLQMLWAGVDAEYAVFGPIMDEMRRVGEEQLK